MLEFAEDIEIDVPKIWQYLGEIVISVIEDGTISLDILTKAPSSVIESGKVALLLAEVLKLSEKDNGEFSFHFIMQRNVQFQIQHSIYTVFISCVFRHAFHCIVC